MIIIAGLGNPHPKYENTPHNVGFETINKLQKENNFPKFNFSKKFESKISEKKIKKEKIILAKPQTFMNSSGKSISALKSYYKIKNPKKIWIIHDDIDIPLGKIKISENKNSAGHKGVQSIINKLKTKEFVRFRIGVRPPKKPDELKRFVLKKIKEEERKEINKVIKKITKTIEEKIK